MVVLTAELITIIVIELSPPAMMVNVIDLSSSALLLIVVLHDFCRPVELGGKSIKAQLTWPLNSVDFSYSLPHYTIIVQPSNAASTHCGYYRRASQADTEQLDQDSSFTQATSARPDSRLRCGFVCWRRAARFAPRHWASILTLARHCIHIHHHQNSSRVGEGTHRCA